MLAGVRAERGRQLTRVEEQQDDDLEGHQDQLQRLLWEIGLYCAGSQAIDPRQLAVLCGALVRLLLAASVSLLHIYENHPTSASGAMWWLS